MKKLILSMLIGLVTSAALAQVPPPPSASQAEVNVGVSRTKFVSPATLKAWTGGTNLYGVLSKQVCYVSASYGTVTPAVNDPNNPYLSAQTASFACPSNGFVVVCDGIFTNEVVTVTNSQFWYFAEGTAIGGFKVPAGVVLPAKFVTGLGDIGIQNQAQFLTLGQIVPNACYFSNNFSSLKIECRNWFGAWAFATTTTNAQVEITAKDVGEGLGHIFLSPMIPQSYTLRAGVITNLALYCYSTTDGTGCYTNGFKTFSFEATKHLIEMRVPPSTTGGSLSNNYILNACSGRLRLACGSAVNRPPFPLATVQSSVTVLNADVDFGPLSSGTTMVKVTLATNDLTFINCRLNVGGNPFSYTSGQINAHYVGCANVTTNYYSMGQVTNIALVDYTVVDSSWTNGGYRF